MERSMWADSAFTCGHDYDNAEGTGSLKGAPMGSLSLANCVGYGAKVGYFHLGRLNWQGLEIEGFNSTSHVREGSGLPRTCASRCWR